MPFFFFFYNTLINEIMMRAGEMKIKLELRNYNILNMTIANIVCVLGVILALGLKILL